MADSGGSALGECSLYCMQDVPSLKIVPCTHDACITCLQYFYKEQKRPKKLKCPTCKQMITLPPGGPEALPSRFFGKLSCDYCLKSKDVSEFWFCDSCVKIFCSRCDVVEHRTLDHEITPWDSADGVKYCVGYLSAAAKRRSLAKSDQGKMDEVGNQKIATFLGETKAALVQKLENPDLDKAIEKLQKAQELLQSSYAIHEAGNDSQISSETISNQENYEKLLKVVKKALNFSLGDSSDVELPDCIKICSREVTGFKISAEDVADYIWASATFEKWNQHLEESKKSDETEKARNGSSSGERSGSSASHGTGEATRNEAHFHAYINGTAWREISPPKRVRLCPSAVAVVCDQKIGIWFTKGGKKGELNYRGSLTCEDSSIKFKDVALINVENKIKMFIAYTKELGSGEGKELLLGIRFLGMDPASQELLLFQSHYTVPVVREAQSTLVDVVMCSDGEECFLGSSWESRRDALFSSFSTFYCRLDRINGMTGRRKSEIKQGFQDKLVSPEVRICSLSCASMSGNGHMVAVYYEDPKRPAGMDPGGVALVAVEGDRAVEFKEMFAFSDFQSLVCFKDPSQSGGRGWSEWTGIPGRTLEFSEQLASSTRRFELSRTGFFKRFSAHATNTLSNGVSDGVRMKVTKTVELKGNKAHAKDALGFCFIDSKTLRLVRYPLTEKQPRITDLKYHVYNI